MTEKLTDLEEAAARLSMLEFAIEVMFANWFAHLDETNSDQMKADLVRVMTKSYGPLTGDLDTAHRMRAMSERGVEMMQRLVDKVSRRELEIRARRSPG